MSTDSLSRNTLHDGDDEEDLREPFEWLAEEFDEDHRLGRAARIALQSLEDSSEASR